MGGDFAAKVMQGQPFDQTNSMGKLGNVAWGMSAPGQAIGKLKKGGEIVGNWQTAKKDLTTQQTGAYTAPGTPAAPGVVDLLSDLSKGKSSNRIGTSQGQAQGFDWGKVLKAIGTLGV